MSNEPDAVVESDPVLDMMMMQNQIDELQEKCDEQEYFITALQDSHRLELMNHLLPHYLSPCKSPQTAIAEARKTADETINVMAEEMNKKAAEYRELVEKQRQEAKDRQVMLASTDEEVEN